MGIEPYLLRQSLKGAIAQRLIRKLCPRCKEKILIDFYESGKEKKTEVFKAKGCNYCYGTGYKGRVMISDVVDFTEVNFSNFENMGNLGLVRSAKEFMLKGEISIEDYLLFREGEVASET